jgi:Fe-S cluster assembly protein SufD
MQVFADASVDSPTAVTYWTPERAASLGGPASVQEHRRQAAERFAGMAIPTEAEEVWRYSRVGDIDLEAYTLADGDTAAGAEPAIVATVCDLLGGAAAALVVVVDGHVVRADVRAAGVVVTTGGDVDERAFGAAAGTPTEAFTTLNDAFAQSPVHVDVAPGAAVDGPILVFHCTTRPHTATFPRTIVTIGDNAEATVLEHHSSAHEGGANALTVPVTELAIATAGRLQYLNVQALDEVTHQIAHQASRIERDATLRSTSVALGGDYARIRTDSRLTGQGASSELRAVYFGERRQMHDFRTLQAHEAPNTTSDLLFKGAVEDQARGVYSGLIRIEKQAQKSNANQTNRNLVLSDGAHADSVPNLEIEANDVRCSHATAVGPIDEEQRYYVESRGIPPHIAERLIVLGFFGEVLARIPGALAPLEDELRRQVAEKLQRRTSA